MREDDTVNRAIGGNGKFIGDPVDRISQELETGNQRDIKITTGKLLTERCRMIERYKIRPAVDEWPGVEVFYTAEACRLQSEK